MSDSPGAGGLGSLAQSARNSQLRSARIILVAIGVLTILLNLVFALLAEKVVDRQFKKELTELRAQGLDIDATALAELRAGAIRSVRLSGALFVSVGVVFLVLAALVYKYPVPVTVTGLLLYLGCIAVTAAVDPSTLAKGWLVRILFIVGLAKSVQAAVASEKELREVALEPLPATP
jgi:hypothetical protein